MVRDDRLPEPDPETAALAAAEACGRGVADVTPIPKGINAIYRVAFEDGREAVLKAATFNAAAELRPEPRLLEAVAGETAVPVPDVLAVVEEGGPIEPFHFLLEYREGRQIRDLDALGSDDQRRLVRAVGRNLARLHEVRPADACGPLRMTDPDDGSAPEFTAAGGGDSWGEVFASLADHPISLVEQVQCGDDPGRFADLVPDIVAAFEGVADAVAEPETPTLLHRDFHLDNLVLSPGDDAESAVSSAESPVDDAESPIRTVLDFGDPYVGDYRLDLAFAEDAVIRVQLPASDRADDLAELLRATYADERGIDSDEVTNRSYPYYLLVQRSRWMSVALDWEACDDPAAVERAYRTFVAERLDEIA